jgi:hypothetical protein
MPNWLDAISDLSSKTARGYTSAEKYAESLRAPYPMQDGMPSPEAERFAAQKLAAQAGRPAWAADLFNQIALADLFKTAAERNSIKKAGEIGFITGHNRRALGQK